MDGPTGPDSLLDICLGRNIERGEAGLLVKIEMGRLRD
jgi:hypothetical protein